MYSGFIVFQSNSLPKLSNSSSEQKLDIAKNLKTPFFKLKSCELRWRKGEKLYQELQIFKSQIQVTSKRIQDDSAKKIQSLFRKRMKYQKIKIKEFSLPHLRFQLKYLSKGNSLQNENIWETYTKQSLNCESQYIFLENHSISPESDNIPEKLNCFQNNNQQAMQIPCNQINVQNVDKVVDSSQNVEKSDSLQDKAVNSIDAFYHFSRANQYFDQGLYQLSKEQLEQILILLTKSIQNEFDLNIKGKVTVRLGDIHRKLGLVREAAKYYTQVVEALSDQESKLSGLNKQDFNLFIQAKIGQGRLAGDVGDYSTFKKIGEEVNSLLCLHPEHTLEVDTEAKLTRLRGAVCLLCSSLSEARELFLDAARMSRQNSGGDSVEVGRWMSLLAQIPETKRGQDPEAASDLEDWAEAAERIFEACGLQTHHPLRAQNKLAQARILLSRGQLSDASDSLLQAYSSFELLFGSRHPRVAETLIELGNLNLTKGLPMKALRCFESASEILESTGVRETHLGAVACLEGLSGVAELCGDSHIAVRYMRKALDLLSKLLDDLGSSVHRSAVLCSLAVSRLLSVQGLCEEAGEHLSAAHELIQKKGLDDSSLDIECAFTFGVYSMGRGLYCEAQEAFSRCLIAEQLPPAPPPQDPLPPIRHALMLSETFRKVGNFEEASRYLSMVSNLTLGVVEGVGVRVVRALWSKGQILRDLGQVAESETLLREALKMIPGIASGEVCGLFSSVLADLGDCLRIARKFHEAEEAGQWASSIRFDLFGPDHLYYRESLFLMSLVFLDSGRHIEAAKALTSQVIPFFESMFGRAHPLTVYSYANLGMCYLYLESDIKAMEVERQLEAEELKCYFKEWNVSTQQGQMMIAEALILFSQSENIRFSTCHPWVLRLGGYVTDSDGEEVVESDLSSQRTELGPNSELFE